MTSSGTQIWYGGAATTPNSHTAGGVVIGAGSYQINGQNVGYAGAGGNLTTNPRFWGGTITFAPAAPCAFPPTAGTAVVSNANPCPGSVVQLNVTGGTGGLGQTYQWETSASATGPYTPVGTSQTSALMNLTAANTGYYRVIATCSGMVDSSTPVLVTIPAPFPAGTYTINNALPTGGTNFASFSDAALAINCGVTGPVTFNVAAGTYNNDYFHLDAYINAPGVSITINGNDAILSNLSSTAAEPAIIRLNGTKNVTIDN